MSIGFAPQVIEVDQVLVVVHLTVLYHKGVSDVVEVVSESTHFFSRTVYCVHVWIICVAIQISTHFITLSGRYFKHQFCASLTP
jgi:hypothetical protein